MIESFQVLPPDLFVNQQHICLSPVVAAAGTDSNISMGSNKASEKQLLSTQPDHLLTKQPSMILKSYTAESTAFM